MAVVVLATLPSAAVVGVASHGSADRRLRRSWPMRQPFLGSQTPIHMPGGALLSAIVASLTLSKAATSASDIGVVVTAAPDQRSAVGDAAAEVVAAGVDDVLAVVEPEPQPAARAAPATMTRAKVTIRIVLRVRVRMIPSVLQ